MSKKESILVLDGRKEATETLRTAFERDDVDVTWTESTHTALQRQGKFARLNSAVLVSDNQEDRGHLLQLVRKLAQFRVPVIVIDTRAGEADRCQLLESGAEAVIGSVPSADELKILVGNAHRMRRELDFLTAENNRIQLLDQALQQRYGQLAEELRLAHKLQLDFLPKSLPQFERMRFASLFRPASWVSGDMFDVQRLDEKHVGLYVADAVGHGLPAALLTMFVRRCIVFKRISGHSYRLVAPEEALTSLNADLIEMGLGEEKFVTALCMIVNVEDRTVHYACGGHTGPMRIDRDGHAEILPSNGALLGIFDKVEIESYHVQLHPGDRLVLFSDGAENALSMDAETAGPRFLAEMAAGAQMDAEAMLADFSNRFCPPDAPPMSFPDDVTILSIDALG